MGKWKHKLSNINTDTKTADCINCGPVSIKLSRGKYYRCRVAINETSRIGKYRRKYGVELIDIPEGCELCGGNCKISYDHSHTTGKHRGWLCMKCNTALGLVGDNVELLGKMIKYLESSS